jgi:hypothetical protein
MEKVFPLSNLRSVNVVKILRSEIKNEDDFSVTEDSYMILERE